MENLKILCIHGIGGKESDNKKDKWQRAWRSALTEMDFTTDTNVHFMDYDRIFDKPNARLRLYLQFIKKTFVRRKAQVHAKGVMDDYPDMIIEFLMLKDVREQLREELKNSIDRFKPDVIYAHSLGSLISYDFFTQPENIKGYENITLITAGSQLGNPFLENHDLKLPLEYLPIKQWYNLNNPHDEMFASHRFNLAEDDNHFKQITTLFFKSTINHDGLEYLKNEQAIQHVWNILRNEN